MWFFFFLVKPSVFVLFCFLVWNWEEKSFERIFLFFIFIFWVRLSKTSLGFTPEIKNWPEFFFFSYFYTLKQITKKFSKFFIFFFIIFFVWNWERKLLHFTHFFSKISIFLIYFFNLSFYMFCQFSSYKHSREKQCRKNGSPEEKKLGDLGNKLPIWCFISIITCKSMRTTK